IQNQAVPERVTLQSRIQDYQSLVSTMRDYMNENWNTGVPSGAAATAPAAPGFGGAPGFGAPAPGFGGMPFPQHAAMRASGGGFPKWILAPLILVFAGGMFYVVKGRAMIAKNAAAAAASASVTAASAVAPSTTAPSTATNGASTSTGTPSTP